MSDSLWSHELQRRFQISRFPCPSLLPGACSSSCPSSQQCHPTISSSVTPFSCLQSFPLSGAFPMSWLFTSGGQSIWASASASVLPINIQGWFPIGLTSLISLQGIFVTQRSNPHLLHLLHWQVGSLTLVLPRKPLYRGNLRLIWKKEMVTEWERAKHGNIHVHTDTNKNCSYSKWARKWKWKLLSNVQLFVTLLTMQSM